MAENWHKRHALQLASMLPDNASDANAVIFGDRPLQSIASDLASAHALAGIICRNEASQSSFIEHRHQEA